MSMSNDDNDIDNRQNRCHRKFEKIVSKFDELIQVMDATTKPPKPKRRRVTSNPQSSRSRSETEAGGSRSNPSNPAAAATTDTITSHSAIRGSGPSDNPTDMNGVLVNVITRHLNDLKTDDRLTESSTSTIHRS